MNHFTLSLAHYYSNKYKLPFLWHEAVRLTGNRNYTVFHLANGSQYLSSLTLSVYESYLPPEFLRIHKSCIVNRNFVVEFNKENLCVLMTDGCKVKVARRRGRAII